MGQSWCVKQVNDVKPVIFAEKACETEKRLKFIHCEHRLTLPFRHVSEGPSRIDRIVILAGC